MRRCRSRSRKSGCAVWRGGNLSNAETRRSVSGERVPVETEVTPSVSRKSKRSRRFCTRAESGRRGALARASCGSRFLPELFPQASRIRFRSTCAGLAASGVHVRRARPRGIQAEAFRSHCSHRDGHRWDEGREARTGIRRWYLDRGRRAPTFVSFSRKDELRSLPAQRRADASAGRCCEIIRKHAWRFGTRALRATCRRCPCSRQEPRCCCALEAATIRAPWVYRRRGISTSALLEFTGSRRSCPSWNRRAFARRRRMDGELTAVVAGLLRAR